MDENAILWIKVRKCSVACADRPGGSEAADAVVNDNPVDCQSRGVTDPQGDRSLQVRTWLCNAVMRNNYHKLQKEGFLMQC